MGAQAYCMAHYVLSPVRSKIDKMKIDVITPISFSHPPPPWWGAGGIFLAAGSPWPLPPEIIVEAEHASQTTVT